MSVILYRATANRTAEEEFLKHFERVCDTVDWTGIENLLLKTQTEMFKGWDKTNNMSYTVGNVFRRSVNGVSVKFITRQQPTQNYEEPWDSPECFTPIQYSSDTLLEPIVCNWVQNEYVTVGCRRIDPIDGLTYWCKFDVIEQSTESPSVARANDPKSWGVVETDNI